MAERESESERESVCERERDSVMLTECSPILRYRRELNEREGSIVDVRPNAFCNIKCIDFDQQNDTAIMYFILSGVMSECSEFCTLRCEMSLCVDIKSPMLWYYLLMGYIHVVSHSIVI